MAIPEVRDPVEVLSSIRREIEINLEAARQQIEGIAKYLPGTLPRGPRHLAIDARARMQMVNLQLGRVLFDVSQSFPKPPKLPK